MREQGIFGNLWKSKCICFQNPAGKCIKRGPSWHLAARALLLMSFSWVLKTSTIWTSAFLVRDTVHFGHGSEPKDSPSNKGRVHKCSGTGCIVLGIYVSSSGSWGIKVWKKQ